MKNYQNIEDLQLSFSNCQVCDARCCDGTRGSVYSDLLLSEFESVSENFPILFLRDHLNYLQPTILLTNGERHCRHLENNMCSIYDSRPSTCKTYPLRTDISNDIFIDLSCPAVGKIGTPIVNKGEISNKFDSKILHNYKADFLETYNYFNEYNKIENLEVAFSIYGINFYKFKSDMNNKYLNIHLRSLKNLKKVIG